MSKWESEIFPLRSGGKSVNDREQVGGHPGNLCNAPIEFFPLLHGGKIWECDFHLRIYAAVGAPSGKLRDAMKVNGWLGLFLLMAPTFLGMGCRSQSGEFSSEAMKKRGDFIVPTAAPDQVKRTEQKQAAFAAAEGSSGPAIPRPRSRADR